MAKILFFAPNSAIWAYSFPEALIAESLAQSGHQIIYVTCGETYSEFCASMAAMGVSEDSTSDAKKKICELCKSRKRLIRSEFHLKGPDLSERITDADQKEVSAILESVNRRNFFDLKVGDINVGALSVYEYLIHHKKLNPSLSEEEWQQFRPVLRQCLLTIRVCERLYREERPDAMVVYNSLYSVNAIASAVASKHRIPHYFTHAGGNLSNFLRTLLIGQGSTVDFIKEQIRAWETFRDIPCHQAILSQITDHFLELLGSTSVWVYSSARSQEPVSVRERLGVSDGQRLVVAAMSSPDEDVAATVAGVLPPSDGILYETQLDWIRDLISFTSDRPDLFLVIRVHPREFPNRREGVKSEHAVALEKTLTNLPPNVRVNWPSDGLSLYDLAEETDVFLCAWSSAGKEMSLFGIPVVLYSDKKILYPADLTILGETREEYFSAIERALKSGWEFERIRRAYRWYGLEFVRGTVDLSDSCNPTPQSRAFFPRAVRKLRRLMNPTFQEIADCRRRSRYLKERTRIATLFETRAKTLLELPGTFSTPSLEEETVAIRDELKRLTDVMYAGYPTAVKKGTLREKLLSAL